MPDPMTLSQAATASNGVFFWGIYITAGACLTLIFWIIGECLMQRLNRKAHGRAHKSSN
jgi:hypothetical protein